MNYRSYKALSIITIAWRTVHCQVDSTNLLLASCWIPLLEVSTQVVRELTLFCLSLIRLKLPHCAWLTIWLTSFSCQTKRDKQKPHPSNDNNNNNNNSFLKNACLSEIDSRRLRSSASGGKLCNLLPLCLARILKDVIFLLLRSMIWAVLQFRFHRVLQRLQVVLFFFCLLDVIQYCLCISALFQFVTVALSIFFKFYYFYLFKFIFSHCI